MSIQQHPWDLHKAGGKDAYRHKEKLSDAFKKQLHDIISQEDIITQEGGKKVRVPIKALDSYRFIFDPKKQKQLGQGDGQTQKGDVLQKDPKKGDKGGEGDSKPGNDAGEDIYEAEVDIDDLIEMMLEDLKLPRLDPKKKNAMKATDIRFDDVRKKGAMSNLDKKRSVINNIRRNAASGEAKIGVWDQDDLRFRTWSEHERPVTSAVVFALMDVSASMGSEKKYLARSFFFWMVNFLRHKYERVEIEFIAHTTEAKSVNEQDFFHKGESGGTRCSSAYTLADAIIEHKYPVSDWNIFVFHFSDGETWDDEPECARLIEKLSQIANMVGYGEIDLSKPAATDASYYGLAGGWVTSKLSAYYSQHLKGMRNFVQGSIHSRNDVWPILKRFFNEELD